MNGPLNAVLGRMGHTDRLCVSDCGLPIPDQVPRIDLAYKWGEPPFLDVLQELAGQMVVERIFLAQESLDQNPALPQAVERLFPGVPWEAVPHEELKKMVRDCKAVVRTGESTPYANVILQSGCIF